MGHYCFVAVVGAPDDLEPGLPATFLDWVRFVRENNNFASVTSTSFRLLSSVEIPK